MKWANHQLTTLAGVYAVSGNLPFSIAVAAFSHLPDMVEFGPGKLVFSRHRGASHNIFLWLAVMLLFLPFAHYPLIQQAADVIGRYGFQPWWVIAPGLGALCHLTEDAMSVSGITIWRGRKFAGKLYRTGTASEFAVAMGFVVLMVPVAYLHRIV